MLMHKRGEKVHLNNAAVVAEDLARLYRLHFVGAPADVPEAYLGIVGAGQQMPLQKWAPRKAIPGQVRARSASGHIHMRGT